MRGHGSGYAALARGRVDINRLRTALTAVSLPRAADGRLVLAVDVTCWLRPEAHTSRQRILCHTYGRRKDQHTMVPGWPYSVVVALETGRHSWTAPLDAIRLAPGDNATSVTARQIRDVVDRLVAAGHWRSGDPEILVVADAGIAWAGHDGVLPVIEGTVIRLEAQRLPSGAIPKPVWLWHSRIGLDDAEVDLAWQAFLRRFDIQHTFRMLKQTLGWTTPKLRAPEAADRWTWLLPTACTQLRLAPDITADLRRP